MNEIITTEKTTTLEDRYQVLNKLIGLALHRWHPDRYQGDDLENAERMTRGLLGAKRKARQTYHHLKGE